MFVSLYLLRWIFYALFRGGRRLYHEEGSIKGTDLRRKDPQDHPLLALHGGNAGAAAGYHDNDIAQSLKYLNRAERNLLYSALDAEWLAEIISYIDDPVEYVDEIGIDKLSAIINEMDADDAVDLWGEHRRKRQGQAAPDDRRPDQGRDPAHQFL